MPSMISCVIVAHRQHASKTGFLCLSSIWARYFSACSTDDSEKPPPSSRRYSLAESVLAQRPAQWLIEDVGMLCWQSKAKRQERARRGRAMLPHMSIACRDEPSHGVYEMSSYLICERAGLAATAIS